MLFGKLLPREGNFFEMFDQHAERIVEAARAFAKLVANYDDPHLREQYNRDVDNAERAADRVTHDVNRLIHRTFITPIDRDQIHTLINTMDDVCDLIQDSAETMALYDIHHMTDEITRLTDISVKCCERVRDAVKLLDKIVEAARAFSQLVANYGDVHLREQYNRDVDNAERAAHDRRDQAPDGFEREMLRTREGCGLHAGKNRRPQGR